MAQTAQQFLSELFEYEYCAECGGDADDHDAIIVMGNWFARCRHPLPDLPNNQITAELERRHAQQEAGLAMTPA
jgi:hypothetical protein